MAGTKRDRQKALRQARIGREAARAQAQARRRRATGFGLVSVLVAVIAVLVVTRGGGTDADTETAASGVPCVAISDPLPVGAPNVPVRVGAPPKALVSEDLKVGTGASVGRNDTVTVNYIGVSCSTGKIFDSSYSRNQPATFALSGVIRGWTVGIPNMKIGGQRLLGIPPDQGYGAEGRPPTIAPNETLWFVVELVGIA